MSMAQPLDGRTSEGRTRGCAPTEGVGADQRVRPIDVSRDYEGLEIAAVEAFEEALLSRAQQAAEERMPGADLGQVTRTVSEGYFARVAHLSMLRQILEAGITMPLSTLDQSEILGLQALERAKNRFEREHPPCASCGALQLRNADTLCWNCFESTAKEGAK